MQFLGIDFSGSAEKWRDNVRTPTVWISELSDSPVPKVVSLYPAQDLSGPQTVFSKVASMLKDGDFISAGIDAPFSVPIAYIPSGGWQELVALNNQLPHVNRPFPKADTFLNALTDQKPSKPLRRTEDEWCRKGVNVRSSMWWKPRGGAPFTTACLKLIAMSAPEFCWPWSTAPRGMLVEAFPAAQLRQWGLEYQGYNGEKGRDTRCRIVEMLAGRISFGEYEATVRASADALDAVLAGFAGIAASCGMTPPGGEDWPADEGRISVHI